MRTNMIIVFIVSLIIFLLLECDSMNRISSINHHKSILLVNAVLIFSQPSFADVDIDLNRVKLIRETENFLTNPVLEAFRKIDQLESDETLDSQKAILLYPIIEISKDIENIKEKLVMMTRQEDDKKLSVLNDIKIILSSNKYNAKEFKKTFNRYSDNIFYQDPRRANIYLGGGAIPDSSQTNKYLYRNVALTSIENLKDDIDILIKDKQWDDQQAIDDTLDDIKEATDAFNNYFTLIDPNDIKISLEIYKSSHK